MPLDLISNVPSFVRDHDAGSMAVTALSVALGTQGDDRPDWWLAGVSGDAFKFVYDAGPVFEPLRDRNPLDVVETACRAAGWEGHWSTTGRAEIVEAVVRQSIGAGRPLLAPFLGEAWYHGMVLVVGIDDARRRFLLQRARTGGGEAGDYELIAIPDRWDGPVPGDVAWSDAPLFVLEGRRTAPPPTIALATALARAIELHGGRPLPYAGHPGAQRYSGVPLAGRVAPQGDAAFRLLRHDILRAGTIGFDLIWRIDAQLGQLHYDRRNAARFLRVAAGGHPAAAALTEAAERHATTADIAKRIQHAFWDKSLGGEADASAVRSAVNTSSSLVYALGGLPAQERDRLHGSLPVVDTPWGPAGIADAPSRRERLAELVDRVIEAEGRAVAALGRAV